LSGAVFYALNSPKLFVGLAPPGTAVGADSAPQDPLAELRESHCGRRRRGKEEWVGYGRKGRGKEGKGVRRKKGREGFTTIPSNKNSGYGPALTTAYY